MLFLQTILCLVILFSAFMVAFSENPIDSILFLILTFVTSGALLFLFNAEFFGLILVVVYVGAIAVLFLFVIMMLNVKTTSSQILSTSTDYWSVFAWISFMAIVVFVIIEYVFQFSPFEVNSNRNIIIFDNLDNIDVLGQVLYNYYVFGFLIAGLILLVALIGSIVLTLRFNRPPKKQLINRQLSRTDNFLAFFK